MLEIVGWTWVFEGVTLGWEVRKPSDLLCLNPHKFARIMTL
jgi:hypothetical protein